jgi:hypothetical protein
MNAMQKPLGALWRIEYRADATRADSTTIPVGFMLEADWQRRARWLGLYFRQKLTAPELDLVNLHTYPELRDLDKFMNELFDRAWEVTVALGSEEIAKLYPAFGALQFVPETMPLDLGEFDAGSSFQRLYALLLEQQQRLQPVLSAPVISIAGRPSRRPFVMAPEAVELLNKAA